jgi:hypothetical protein
VFETNNHEVLNSETNAKFRVVNPTNENNNKQIQIIDNINPFDEIDGIYYISSDKDTYKHSRITQEIYSIGYPLEKLHRISKSENSFIDNRNALKLATDHKCEMYLILCDDDFIFHDIDQTKSILTQFWKSHITWDMLILSGDIKSCKTCNFDFVMRITNCQSISGFFIHSRFTKRLIRYYTAAIQRTDNEKPWKALQHKYLWYSLIVDNDDDGGDLIKIESPELLICVQITSADKVSIISPSVKENIIFKNLTDKYKSIQLVYIKYNPDIDSLFTYDPVTHILQVKCKVENIHQNYQFYKLCQAIQSIQQLNVSYKSLQGVYFTKFETIIDLNTFYDKFKTFKNTSYWGCSMPTQFFNNIELIDISISKESIEKYPAINNYPFLIDGYKTTSVFYHKMIDGFYINMNSIQTILSKHDIYQPIPNTDKDIQKYIYQNKYFKNLHMNRDKTIAKILL